MEPEQKREKLDPRITWAIFSFLAVIALYIVWSVAFHPIYKVWQQGKHGEAALREAEYSRQIKVTEAKAKLESEKLNKESEIVRAEGVAKANQIISGTITDQYIRYLWVKTLDENHNQIIYVPTEANLPITEAPRLKP